MLVFIIETIKYYKFFVVVKKGSDLNPTFMNVNCTHTTRKETKTVTSVTKTLVTLVLTMLLMAGWNVSWGQTASITITNASIGGSGVLGSNNYGSGAERTWTQSSVSFGGKAITCNPANTPASSTACQYIQAQANNGVIYNTSALPGRIVSVRFIGSASVASSLFGGTSRLINTTAANYTVTGGTQIGAAQTSTDYTWTTGPTENYTFFCLKRGASAQYFSSIIVTYETGPSNNADLSAWSLSTGTLSPTFAAGTTSYTATVPYTTTSITTTATRADAGASLQVQVNGGGFTSLTSGSPSGSLSLNVGSNTVDVKVTAADGTTTKTYTTTVTRSAASTNANLSALTTTAGAISPTFAGGTTAYSVSVGSGVSSATVTATVADATATLQVRINGGSYTSLTSGAASGSLSLNVGSNTIDVLVTAQDGTTTKTYTITVTRAASLSTNADLSALTTTAGSVSPSFAAGTTSYTASVLYAVTSVTVTATKADVTASLQVRVNGGSYTALTSGSASGALSLNVGANTIDVLVTAEDGTTTKTYTITVTRAAASTVSTLSAMTLSSGTLSPSFASGTTAYTASVINTTTSLTVTSTVTDATASIQVRVNGGTYTSVSSGAASGSLSLNVGSNTVDVKVTAQDGTTITTYTTTVTRAASSVSTLSALTTTAGTLSPTFASGTTSYTASVAYTTTSVTVTPTVTQANATIQVRVNGGSYSSVTSGAASGALSLNVGSNPIDVLVTAQDGVTTSTYTITVTRAAASTNNNLSALTTTAGTITPSFAAGTTSYTASVSNSVSSVTVTATRADATATLQVQVNGGGYSALTSGSASGALSLNVGSNTIDVLVTAQDASTKTYTITVTRSQAPIWSNPITGTNPGQTSPWTSGQTVASNLSVSGISRTGVTGANANDRFSASNWSTGAIDLGKYFEFVLTPDPGYKIDFTNFVFTGQTSSGTPTLAIRSSADGFASNIANPAASGATVSLSSFTNITAAITFRVYVYGIAATGTTYSINDFEFNGSVAAGTPVPEINVLQGATPIASGGTHNFGSVELGTSGSAVTFTIQNSGTSTLNLSGSPIVVKSGTNAADFTVNQTGTSSTVASGGGSTTFTVTFTPGGAGARTAQLTIANDDADEGSYVINLSATGTNSAQSDIIYNSGSSTNTNTNLDYATYQASSITGTGNSIAVFGFTIRDGGGAADNDGLGTTLTDISFTIANWANVRSARLFNGVNPIGSSSVSVTGSTISFSGLSESTTDGGSLSLNLRITFNSTVTDNQQLQFTIASATASTSGSSFASANAGGAASNITGDINRIEVTASKLRFGTVTGSSVNVALPSFNIYAADGLDNTDLDYSTTVTLTTSGVNMTASGSYALSTGSVAVSNVVYTSAPQTNITLTASNGGSLTNATSSPFSISNITIPTNSFRTNGSGTSTWASATWQQWDGSNWNSSSAPAAGTSNAVYIRQTITTGSITASNLIVENGGTLVYSASSSCAGTISVESGGILQINTATVNMAGGTLTVKSGGRVNITSASISGVSSFWNGTEDFQDGSIVDVQNWNYGAGSGDNRLIQNPSIISQNAAGYYFGNLTISGTPTALFGIVESGQTDVKVCQNNLTIATSAQVVANSTSAGSCIIGGNVIVNSGTYAFSAVTGTYTTTVNGDITVNSGGTLNMSTQSGAQTSIVQLKGNLSIPSGGTILCTSDVGNIVFSGTSGAQTISIVGTLNTRVAFEVGDGTNASTLQLVNQNLSLANSLNKLTVNNAGILEFNNFDVTGAGIFVLNAGGTLKITSAAGVNASGTNTGNLQNTGSRTISQSGIFHYVGSVSPQSTGTAMTSGSTAKRIIIEKTNSGDVVNLTQSTGTTDRLEIRQGVFVESAAATVNGSGALVMSGGEYRIALTGTTVPQLTGTYTLSGGTINLNGAGNQTLRGGSIDYRGLTFATSGTKTLTSSPSSVTGTVTVSDNAILDVASNTLGGAGTNLTMTGSSRYRTSASGTRPGAQGTYTLGSSSTIEFYGSSAILIRTTPTYANIEVAGTNVALSTNTASLTLQSGTGFTVKNGATFYVRNVNGFSGGASTAVKSNNSPTITLETGATLNYNCDDALQSIEGSSYDCNLVLSNNGPKTFTASSVTISGNFSASGGPVTGATTMTFTGGSTNIAGIDYKNVVINSTGTKTLTGAASIGAGNSLTFTAGTLDLNSQDVTLKSSSSGTASVGAIPGNGANLLNATNVIVERYIPARRAWRGISVPLSSATAGNSIFNNWQNNGVVIGGEGVLLWNSTGTGGYSQNTSSGSNTNLRSYTGGTGYAIPATTTGANLISGGKPVPYLVFVTDYYKTGTNTGNMASGATATRLKAKGTLYTGDYQTGTLVSGYHMIANPYPSPITLTSGILSTVNDKFWVWDPKLISNGGYGGYVTTTNGLSTPVGGGGSYTSSNRVIPAGGAFWVFSNGSGSVSLNETAKNGTNFNIYGRYNNGATEVLRVNLVNLTGDIYDGVATGYQNNASASIDGNDAAKFSMAPENISIRRNGVDLAIEFRPLVDSSDTIFLNLYQLQKKEYALEITGEDFDVAANLTAILQDLYLNKETVLNIYGSQTYKFTVDNNAASSGERFRIVFRPSAVTPVTDLVSLKTIKLYPNPVAKGTEVQLQFRNSSAGKYEVTLYNLVGVQVMKQTITHGGGNGVQKLDLPQAMAAGTYIAEITDAKGNKGKVKLVIE